jgi:hypothetical protein
MPNRINHGTDMLGEIIDAVGTAALKVTPPVTVATAVASGFTLDKAVLVLTAIYLLVGQIGYLVWKWIRE